MIRTIVAVLATLSLSACGGVLAFEHDDEVFAGPLDDMDVTDMKSRVSLASRGSFDQLEYAIDRGGTLVGICRSKLGSSGAATELVFDVYTILGTRKFRKDALALADDIDDHLGGSDYRTAAESGHFLCTKVGASDADDELVLYFEALSASFESFGKNAVEFDAGGSDLEILAVEHFPQAGSPQQVVAQENPPRGHDVIIDSNGMIRIDGRRVRLDNPQPPPPKVSVEADSVKWQFD